MDQEAQLSSVPVADREAQLGGAVARQRRAHGWSQAVLAERSECSPRYVQLIERGRVRISVDLLERLAAALGVEVEELAGTDREAQP